MFDNKILDVAIGLILMYLMLSLIVTVLNEFIATKMDLRGKQLQEALVHLVDDPNLKSAFDNSGVMKTLTNATNGRFSYIDGKTFAAGLLRAVETNADSALAKDVQGTIDKLPPSDIKDVLLGLASKGVTTVAAIHTEVAVLHTEVANWFDSTMDRVSGIYKRKLKIISVLVGLGVAVSFNADSVYVSHELWVDKEFRAAALEQARTVVADSAIATKGAASDESKSAAPDFAKMQADHKTAESALAVLKPFPIGWNSELIKPTIWATIMAIWAATFDIGPVSIVLKGLGWAITALALSLGAPFWFDLLTKFVNIRGAGKPPEKTHKP